MLNIKTIFIQLVNFVGFFFALRDKKITPPLPQKNRIVNFLSFLLFHICKMYFALCYESTIICIVNVCIFNFRILSILQKFYITILRNSFIYNRCLINLILIIINYKGIWSL